MKTELGGSIYSIDAIERSIVMDNPIGTLPLAEKQRLYDEALAKLARFPALAQIIDIRHIRTYPMTKAGLVERIGAMPSKLVITDPRIKEMCRLPYWSLGRRGPNGEPPKMKFGPCPDVDRHSSCPSFSPLADEVRARLDEADIFVMLQSAFVSDMRNYTDQLRCLPRLQKDIEAVIGKGAVRQRFGHGSCRACGQPCLRQGDCRTPALYTAALESQGVPVAQLNRDMAELSGDKSWEMEFIRNFGMPNQTPSRWKYTLGLAVRLPAC